MFQSLQQNRFASDVIRKRNIGYIEERRTETGYDTDGQGKIHAGNIVTWAHLIWRWAEWREGRDRGVTKAKAIFVG